MAAGDITITAGAKTVTVNSLVLTRMELIFSSVPGQQAVVSEARVYFGGADGAEHVAVIRNAVGTCVGFDLAAGVFTDGIVRSGNLNELNTFLGILFAAGAKTNGVNELISKGIVTITGTVA